MRALYRHCPVSVQAVVALALTAAPLLLSACGKRGDRVLITETRERFSKEPDPRFGATDQERFPELFAQRRDPGESGDPVRNPFRWETPEGWTEKPESRMRLINLSFGPNGQGECYLTALPGGGGGVVANVNRWRDQMGEDPLTEEEVSALPDKMFLGAKAKLVDLEGDFGGMSFPGAPAAEAKKDYRLIGLIQEQDPFTFFIKMTGPKEVVAKEQAAFDAFCQSITLGAH